MFGLPFLGGGGFSFLPIFVFIFLGINNIIRAIFPAIFGAAAATPM